MNPDRIRAAAARATGTAPALTGYQKDICIQRFAGISANDTPLNPFSRVANVRLAQDR
jgi:hypothetical protein